MPDYMVRRLSDNSVEFFTATPPFTRPWPGPVGEDYQIVDLTNGQTISAVDGIAPTLASSVPADGATGIAVDANIVLTFSEAVQAGTGNFYIYDDGPTLLETIAVGSVTISGTDVTINPTSDFANSANINIQWDAGVVTDTATSPNGVAANADPTLLNFTVVAAGVGPDTPDVIMGANSLSWFSAANSAKWQDSARTVPATAASDPVYAVADEEGGFLETDDNARRGVLGVDGGVTFIDMASAHLSRAITGTQTMGMTIALRVPTAAYSRLALVASLYDHPSNYWQGANMLVDENTAVNWLQARTSGGDEVYVASGVDSRGWIVIQATFEVDSTSTGNVEISEDGVTSTSPTGQTTPSAVIAAPNALDIGLALESGAYTTVNNSEFDLAAFALYDTIPTPTQLADLLTWAGNEVGRTL